ncbi:uncharacterized protein MICPUCDRAFT_65370 [Micromonas pusilla CCMP1545]|uniref:Predicted protein n=1 Tax=Micromonas pusilla (strain CCMP1545) TaxID=564608 RepID=C1MVE7_MICPC|nr:uncharacterized protein MICPUCDRAFT_65370 [Micromonas pusilla CCMP1545]EEH55977.1 predicted protein [Micromonas pusilla CCMP1545]|eukprot:XP_003060025.1 predicted protein [Micromonas pusilla CCMP1545]
MNVRVSISHGAPLAPRPAPSSGRRDGASRPPAAIRARGAPDAGDLRDARRDLRADALPQRRRVAVARSVLRGARPVAVMGTYNGLKAFVGRLRPNFFAACDYKGYATAMATGDYASYLAATTAGADEASLSFPSGHAALSFVAATYTAMALSEGFGRGVCRRGASETAEGRGLRGLLPNGVSPASAASCLTFAFASYVAASRITDYKHRPADVLAGAAIGVAFGVACRPRGTSRWWRMRVFGGGGGDGGRDDGFVTMT